MESDANIDAKVQAVNWAEDSWFRDKIANQLTDEFKRFFVSVYGTPSDYEPDSDEQVEYWERCAFTWIGWKGHADLSSVGTTDTLGLK